MIDTFGTKYGEFFYVFVFRFYPVLRQKPDNVKIVCRLGKGF